MCGLGKLSQRLKRGKECKMSRPAPPFARTSNHFRQSYDSSKCKIPTTNSWMHPDILPKFLVNIPHHYRWFRIVACSSGFNACWPFHQLGEPFSPSEIASKTSSSSWMTTWGFERRRNYNLPNLLGMVSRSHHFPIVPDLLIPSLSPHLILFPSSSHHFYTIIPSLFHHLPKVSPPKNWWASPAGLFLGRRPTRRLSHSNYGKSCWQRGVEILPSNMRNSLTQLLGTWGIWWGFSQWDIHGESWGKICSKRNSRKTWL